MVRKVQPHHKRQIQDDIDREKKNIFLCMHPAATVVTIPDQRSWGRMAGAVTAQKKLRHCKRVLVGPQWQVLASAVASAATNKATTESSANLGFCHSSRASLVLRAKL